MTSCWVTWIGRIHSPSGSALTQSTGVFTRLGSNNSRFSVASSSFFLDLFLGRRDEHFSLVTSLRHWRPSTGIIFWNSLNFSFTKTARAPLNRTPSSPASALGSVKSADSLVSPILPSLCAGVPIRRTGDLRRAGEGPRPWLSRRAELGLLLRFCRVCFSGGSSSLPDSYSSGDRKSITHSRTVSCRFSLYVNLRFRRGKWVPFMN
mmetsp:Transcript_36176/g.58498  ORF Transcript_36176/g.58498 Transcript_36176/m.58498 type:complete len:206 (+) Transcript_36176:1448-2065(+)